MKKHDNNLLSMNYAVQKVVNDNRPVWNGLSAFAAAFTEFETIIGRTGAAIEKQNKSISGVTEDKNAVRAALIDKALEVGGAVHAFASDSGNNALRSSVSFSRSKLIYERAAETLQQCQLIFDQANSVIAQLASYGVDAGSLSDFEAKLAAFAAMIPSTRTAITERKGATDDISKLLKRSAAVLKNKIDKLMEQFKSASPEFYRQYHDARMIVDIGLRHKEKPDEKNAAPAA